MSRSNKLAAAALTLLAGWTLATFLFSSSPNISANAVAITNLEQNSGGTGVVLSSSDTESLILTNGHVCGVVEAGGVINHLGEIHIVAAYKKSLQHDLCLIKVNDNLHGFTNLATSAPTPFSSKAIVSGHPSLFPTIITTGHFSGNRLLPVLIGVEKCSGKPTDDPITCELLGLTPVVRVYESTLVSATIMPGSSGSAVYNENNELSGLVFAGSGTFGYGWIVPYSAVSSFLRSEAATLSWTNLGPFNPRSTNETSGESLTRIKKSCFSNTDSRLEEVCDVVNRDVLWSK